MSTTAKTPLTSPSTGEVIEAVVVPHFTLRKMVDSFIEETKAKARRG